MYRLWLSQSRHAVSSWTLTVPETTQTLRPCNPTPLPTTIRSVHILECTFDGDDHPGAPIVLPHLESLVFTSFGPSTGSGVQKPANDNAYSLDSLQPLVESFVVAPRCTFKYLRSTKSSEKALAVALAELGLESS